MIANKLAQQYEQNPSVLQDKVRQMQKTDSVQPEMASKLDAHISEADSKPILCCHSPAPPGMPILVCPLDVSSMTKQ